MGPSPKSLPIELTFEGNLGASADKKTDPSRHIVHEQNDCGDVIKGPGSPADMSSRRKRSPDLPR